MTNFYSKQFTLSKQEASKSLRDAVIVGGGYFLGYFLPILVDTLAKTDFGKYSSIVSLVLSIISPLINRYVNIWRIK